MVMWSYATRPQNSVNRKRRVGLLDQFSRETVLFLKFIHLCGGFVLFRRNPLRPMARSHLDHIVSATLARTRSSGRPYACVRRSNAKHCLCVDLVRFGWPQTNSQRKCTETIFWCFGNGAIFHCTGNLTAMPVVKLMLDAHSQFFNCI